uniref:Sulfotransferase n=1 Tax=Chenopodium quinoa TaxID=63459 RepID=A0A803LNU7_CHEQI
MADDSLLSFKEILVHRKSPLLLRLIVLVFAMVCGIYICFVCLKQFSVSTITTTGFLNVQVSDRPCPRPDLEDWEVPYVHYPKPVTYSRAECACHPVRYFAILSTQRSGSGWFETLLNSHMNVSSNGEIFSVKVRRANASTIVETLDKLYNLDWFSSASKNECTAAVGLKWMLNQVIIKKVILHLELYIVTDILDCIKYGCLPALSLFFQYDILLRKSAVSLSTNVPTTGNDKNRLYCYNQTTEICNKFANLIPELLPLLVIRMLAATKELVYKKSDIGKMQFLPHVGKTYGLLEDDRIGISLSGLMQHHEDIVDYFTKKGVSVIFLFRRNLLRRMVSILANTYDRDFKLLNGTHKSHVHSPHEAEILASYKPYVNATTLIPELKKVQQMAAKALEYFNSTRHTLLYYEDVVNNRTKLLDVQDFLRVPRTNLTSRQVKIHKGSLSEQVANWDDVQRTLNGTEFEGFLHADYRL